MLSWGKQKQLFLKTKLVIPEYFVSISDNLCNLFLELCFYRCRIITTIKNYSKCVLKIV